VKQKDLYLQKLAADFEVIRKLVERKHVELKDKIENVYDEHLRCAYRYIDGLTAMKQTISTVTTVSDNLNIDIDQIEINKTLAKQVKEIQTEFDFDVQTAELDLIESRFINEPFHKIEKGLLAFDFMPIKQQNIIDLQKAFVLGGSRILTPDVINADFLMNVMPRIDGKLHKTVNLLYQHTAI
jgi:hypothetical protein